MNLIKTCCVVIAIAVVHTLSGCQQPQKAAAAPAPPQPAPTNDKPCSGQASTPEPWKYNYHTEWELPGATVPEIYAAAKTVLLEDWKMPRQNDCCNDVDFLNASIKIKSALNTAFDLSIIKLNEKSCRLAIDARSKEVPLPQLEEHCSLMYDSIIQYLNTPAHDKQHKKEIRTNNQLYYAIQDYEFDYPVKNVFDAVIASLEQMHISKSNSNYDDFSGLLSFISGNYCEMAIEVQMTDEKKCLLTFFSRNEQDGITKKWGDIFIQRLRQKLAEPQPAAASSSTPESKPAQNIYYGQNRSPSSVSKIIEFSYSVEKIDKSLKDTLQVLNISVPSQTPRDALTAKFNFKTANSADWWATISQIVPNRSKVLFSATNIYAEDFEKYTTTIIENLEKQLQQPEKPAVQSTEPNSIPKRVQVIRTVPKN